MRKPGVNRRARASLNKRRSGRQAKGAPGRTQARGVPRVFSPSPALERLLKQIGVPQSAPFQPDSFQTSALNLVSLSDVLVCAPTGAGKTWIAAQAMARELASGHKSWYASPLKALSNAKYEEFRQSFGDAKVGILTGDRKENPQAPIIVGTTEILRNQLYDAMERGLDLGVDLVVLDEAHYLSDPERGVVWEEVLIYLPVRVRLLLLSATVGNPQEICAWLESIRGQGCALVTAQGRPVPLHALFLHPEMGLGLLLGKRGLGPEAARYLQEGPPRGRRAQKPADFEGVLEGLRRLDMLPAIFFLKSRADCDRAVESFRAPARPPGEQEEIWAAMEPLLREFPILRSHKQFGPILRHRVASHHAGHLPQWKLVVERLMNSGHLEAIFSTSTVAAGVDFPARTVVIPQSDRFNGREFVPLTATELQQMTGRAGRRGKDKVGFALFLPGRHQDLERVAGLLKSPPDPLRSQIQINFSMVLNLLLSQGPEEIRGILEKSLARVQGAAPWREKQEEYPRDPGKWRVKRPPWEHSMPLLRERLGRGRLFLHKNGSVFVAIRMAERRGKPLCMAHKLGGKLKIRKGSLVLRGVHLEEIKALLPRRLDLPPEEQIESLRTQLEMPDAKGLGIGLPPRGKKILERRQLSPASTVSGWLWRSFLEHLAFLKETGFVDHGDRLTPEGRWASRLRLDHPVLVAEAIRKGVFEGRPAPVLAGLMATFVLDRDKEVLVRGQELREMAEAFEELLWAIYEMGLLLAEQGFRTPVLQFWPAAAAYLWAKGLSWKELTSCVSLDDGDLVSLILRTVDHLRQLCDLEETHPSLAHTARLALRRLQREPAVY